MDRTAINGLTKKKIAWIRRLSFLSLLLFLLYLPFSSQGQCDLGKNYAVFFGVADYDANSGWPDLRYPIDDIMSLAQILKDAYQFDTILLRNPTETEIWDQLYLLKEKSDWSPNDQLLLFFSGHGAPGYFIPQDGRAGRERSSAVNYHELTEFINSIPCQHQLVVMDACYSGSFLNGEDRGSNGWPEEDRDENLQILCRHQSRKTRLVMTAAAADSKTPDQSQLVKQFKSMLLDWRNSDEVLYTGTIYQRLKRESSTPLFSAFHFDNDEASSFVFIPKAIRERFEAASPCPLDPEICRIREKLCALCPIDPGNREYPVVAVANTLWMAENLNFVNRGNSSCHDCENYGRLYTWRQAQSACESLGQGWRLPTEEEWIQLSKTLGEGYDIPGPGGRDGDPEASYEKLMASNWKPALAGYLDRGRHQRAGQFVRYWTSTTGTDESEAVVFELSKKAGVMKMDLEKEAGASCRCVRD